MNTMQMVQALMQNPQEIIKKNFANNPMATNLIKLINNKDENGLEQMARNLAKEKGVDADKMFNQYKSMLGM